MKRPTKKKTIVPPPPLRLEWRSPAELTQNPRNWRTHPESQQKALAGILSEVGWAGACLFNERTGLLIDGHLRQKVAIANGAEKVPVLIGDWSPEQEAKILATLDPIAGLAGADPVKLDALLKEVDTGCAEVQQMLADLWDETQADAVADTEPADPVDAEPQTDRAAELQAKWGTAAGQLWLLGKHRLLCGDSTKPEDVARVMGGEKAAIVVTDPPYGLGGYAGRSGKHEAVEGDDKDVVRLLQAIPAAENRYVWCEWTSYPVFLETLGEPTSLIVWGKPWFGMGNGYRRQHEFCLYYGHFDASDQSDLWMLDYKPEGVNSTWQRTEKCQLHPTQKALSVMMKPMQNHGTQGDICFDGFLGSGTTLIAAENLGRRCFGLEISPAYCAVILQRYADAFPDQEIRQA